MKRTYDPVEVRIEIIGNDLSLTLDALIERMTQARDRIPPALRSSAIMRLSPDEPYFDVVYLRPPTAEEMARWDAHYDRQEANTEARERQEYDRLRAKFEQQ